MFNGSFHAGLTGPSGNNVVVEETANVSVGGFGLGECGIDGGPTSELTAGYANAEQNHWTERGRATSAFDLDVTDRPRRSVLSFGRCWSRERSRGRLPEPDDRWCIEAAVLRNSYAL
jgi:hypothetical protein